MMVYRGVYSLIICTLLFYTAQAENTVQAESEKCLENFLQGIAVLKSAVETFEKINPIVSQLVCTSCKEKSTYGLIIGTVIGRGFMAAMKGEDLSDLSKISLEMASTFSTKNLCEVDQFMLNTAQALMIQCPECDAMNWMLDMGIQGSSLA